MMEHPGVDINEVRKLGLDAIQEKIGELYNRLRFAYSMGNQELINQLEMVMAVYQRAQGEILNEMFSPDGDGEGGDTGGKIDIS